MNILDAEDLIKGLPDEALTQEAQMPSGQLPQFLVVSEIQRRTDMRKRYDAQQQQPQGTVAEQIVQEGIMGMMPQQPMGMPQGMPQQMPQQMPPMGMAAGGIVQMSEGMQVPYPALDAFVVGANVGPMPGGSTIKDQLDRAIREGATYPEMIAFINNTFGRKELRDQARSYLASKMQSEMPPTTMSASMIPEMREVLDREPYMAEPMASALARQVESQYATPDLSERVTAEMLTGADPVPSRVPEGLPRPSRGKMASMFPPEYDRQVAASRAGIGEFFSDLSDQYAEGRARDMEFIAGGGRRFSKPGLEPATPIDEILEVAQQSQTDASDPRPSPLAAGDALAPYIDYESVMNVAERNGDMDFSIMDDYFANLNTGDKSVQGGSPVQTQAKPDGKPELDISDILEQSQRMTQADMLMQLGAGIVGGDLSKGISAAGAAGMKGAQEQRALDIRKRLAENQAGREDIAKIGRAHV